MALTRSAHSPQNPPASAASSRGTRSRGRRSDAAAAPWSAVMLAALPGYYLSLSSVTQRPAGRPTRCIRESSRRGVYVRL